MAATRGPLPQGWTLNAAPYAHRHHNRITPPATNSLLPRPPGECHPGECHTTCLHSGHLPAHTPTLLASSLIR